MGACYDLRVYRECYELDHIDCWYLIWFVRIMEATGKITLEVPAGLLDKARRASDAGITQTVRTGLQLVAASEAYDQLRRMKGKVRFSRTVAQLKSDR